MRDAPDPEYPPPSAPTRTVDRALLVLTRVCELGTATLSEIARDTELSTSTAARMLRTLDAQEFVRREGARYRPGARIIEAGALALSSANIAGIGQLELDRIASETGESAYLSLPSPGRQAILAALAHGTHPIRHMSWVGRTVSLDGTAVGQALLGGIGRRGYANLVRVTSPDTTSIASPVHSYTRVVAALSVVVPNFRADPPYLDRVGRIVADAADRLAVQLGVEPLNTKEPEIPAHALEPAAAEPAAQALAQGQPGIR